MGALRKIKYGVPSGNDALTVRFGIEQGIFAAEGLDLSMQVVFGGPELAAAFDTGDISIGSLGSPSGIPAMAVGKRFRIIASGCRQKPHMFLGVRKDIRTYPELKGKRIGLLSIGSCPSWIVRKMLAYHGLQPDTDVTLVPLLDDYPRIIEFMQHGRIDACLATEPNLSIGEDKDVLNIWGAAYDARYLPQFQWIVRVANLDLIEQDPDLIEAVLRGCRLSAHHAKDNIDAFSAFVARYYETSLRTAQRAMHRELPLYQLDCELDMTGLQNSVDMLYELGGIDRPRKAMEFTDMRFQSGTSDAQTVAS